MLDAGDRPGLRRRLGRQEGVEGLLLGCLKLPEPPELVCRAFVRLGAIVEGEMQGAPATTAPRMARRLVN